MSFLDNSFSSKFTCNLMTGVYKDVSYNLLLSSSELFKRLFGGGSESSDCGIGSSGGGAGGGSLLEFYRLPQFILSQLKLVTFLTVFICSFIHSFIHSFHSLSYDRALAQSKARSPSSAI
jgi:hypothetical protein